MIHPDTDVSPEKLMLDFLTSDDVQRFGLDLTGEYDVSAGTLPSVAYDPKLVFGNVIRGHLLLAKPSVFAWIMPKLWDAQWAKPFDNFYI